MAGTQERRKGQRKPRVSTSDPQARVMKHPDKGFALSYNAQDFSTDAAHGLIVGVAVTQEANDMAQLLPAVDRVEQRLEKRPQQMVADSGYTTRENIEKMAGRGVDFRGPCDTKMCRVARTSGTGFHRAHSSISRRGTGVFVRGQSPACRHDAR